MSTTTSLQHDVEQHGDGSTTSLDYDNTETRCRPAHHVRSGFLIQPNATYPCPLPPYPPPMSITLLCSSKSSLRRFTPQPAPPRTGRLRTPHRQQPPSPSLTRIILPSVSNPVVQICTFHSSSPLVPTCTVVPGRPTFPRPKAQQTTLLSLVCDIPQRARRFRTWAQASPSPS